MLLRLFSLSILLVFVSCERFDNYTLYKVFPKNVEHVKFLQGLQTKNTEYDFWDDVTLDYVNILSKPQMKYALETTLSTAGIAFDVTLDNIQDVIDKQIKKNYTRNNIKSMTWTAYYKLEQIYAWLEDLVSTYPDVTSIITGGKTHEGRDIKGIKISHGNDKRAVFIESGIHAREWITPTTTNYIINELLSSQDHEVKRIVQSYDWYIFPVTNPDGYVWTHTENRLWRKNRAPYGDQIGVDLNRNWDNNWRGAGTSSDPSSNNFAGSAPFSEMETRTLSAYIRELAPSIDMYISFHSAGQILLIPFGNTTEPLANYYDSLKVGRRALGALSVRYGTPYTSGNIAEAIYPATGGSIDWVKEALKIPLVYCYELRDRGTYGHLLPEDQILPTGEEVMDSVVEMVLQAERFGIMNSAHAIKVSTVFIFGLIIKINILVV